MGFPVLKFVPSKRIEMRIAFFTSILLASIILLSFKNYSENQVQIKVKNLSGEGAKLYIGFFKRGDGFPKEGKYSFQKVLTPEKGAQSITHTWNITSGTYSVAITEDLNDNGKLDKNFLGIPSEPYGFSKNIHPTFSAPSFEDCSIEISNSTSLVIELID